jgi:tetratricopeptide (TPR) repeat protein
MFIFGFLFYAATIAMVLQFIPVGRAIMADRYSYLSSIGIFILIGFLADQFYTQKKYRMVVMAMVLVYSGVLAVITFDRTKVWKNDETLWTDVMEKYPNDNRIMLPVANRANYFYQEKRMPEALSDYLLATSINPNDDVVLEKIGRIYGKEMNKMDSAMFYFLKAYEKNNKNYDVLTDLGIVCGMRGDLKNSLAYSLEALKINPNDPALCYNIGITYQNLGETEKAKEFLDKSAKINALAGDSTSKK